MNDRENMGLLVGLLAVILSLGAHGTAYLGLRLIDVADLLDFTPLELEMIEPPPLPEEEPPPEPPPPPPEPEEPEPPPPPPRRQREPEPEPEPPPPPPPPAQEIADFTQLTPLSNDEGSFAVPRQEGPPDAPVGPVGVRTGRNRQGVPGGSVGGSGQGPARPVVPPADLSRQPSPPDGLDRVLEQNYPRDARNQGIEGRAVLAAVVGPDGRLARIRVRSESWQGFGEACRRTIVGSRWTPPIDRNGQPVSTPIQYVCTFEIRY